MLLHDSLFRNETTNRPITRYGMRAQPQPNKPLTHASRFGPSRVLTQHTSGSPKGRCDDKKKGRSVRQTPTQTVLPPSILSQNFLQSISPSQSASPSVAQYSAGLAHDARNMLAAMDIYCELLASPGVLKPEDKHLLDELRLLRDSSGKLLDRLLIEALKCLAAPDQAQRRSRGQSGDTLSPATSAAPDAVHQEMATTPRPSTPANAIPSALLYDPADAYGPYNDTEGYPTLIARAPGSIVVSGAPSSASVAPRTAGKRVTNLMAELQSNLPMLSALAGPRVHVSLELGTCPEGELFMPAVDLTRVLINLVRNAAEAMSIGGRILIAATTAAKPGAEPAMSTLPGEAGKTIEASETAGAIETPSAVLISIEDNGPGIPLSLLDRIFDLQASSATAEESMRPRMQFRPRGLGLRIVRDFVEGGGGSVRALRLPDRGSRFEIVLPMVTVKVTQVRTTR